MAKKNGQTEEVDFDRLMKDLKTVVSDGEELLRARVADLKEKAIAGAKSTDTVIRDRPYQTMGIALGLGVVIGILVTGMFRGGSSEAED